jgi:hypothetical protein
MVGDGLSRINECEGGVKDSDIMTSIIHLPQVSNIKILIK